MKKFVIISDSCCDLNKGLREKYDVDYVPMYLSANGKTYVASLDYEELPAKEFYGEMRNGTRFLTSQVNANSYREKFEEAIKEGKDVLYIGCSSALSNSVKSSYIIRDELLEKYPDAKIVCIDGLNSSYGLGIICIIASILRSEGKSLEEVAAWVEENKLCVHQEACTEKLSYLKQAGRVSAASAFFGGLLNIKPVIISDVNGQNVAVEKVKGRKASMERLVQRMNETYRECVYPKIHIIHADCLEDAEELKEMVLQVKPNVEVIIDYIGPIVGASVGPGTIGLYFYGTEETYDSKKA